MKKQRISRRLSARRSGSRQHDDGQDRYDRSDWSDAGRKESRKAAQLCSQVRRTLELAVPEVLANSDYDLMVLDVQLAPNTANLLVLVTSGGRCADLTELQRMEAALASKSGYLRAVVAHAISRRRAPQLIFRMVPT